MYTMWIVDVFCVRSWILCECAVFYNKKEKLSSSLVKWKIHMEHKLIINIIKCLKNPFVKFVKVVFYSWLLFPPSLSHTNTFHVCSVLYSVQFNLFSAMHVYPQCLSVCSTLFRSNIDFAFIYV